MNMNFLRFPRAIAVLTGLCSLLSVADDQSSKVKLNQKDVGLTLAATFREVVALNDPAQSIRRANARVEQVKKLYRDDPALEKFYSEIGHPLVSEKESEYQEEVWKLFVDSRPELMNTYLRLLSDIGLIVIEVRESDQLPVADIAKTFKETELQKQSYSTDVFSNELLEYLQLDEEMAAYKYYQPAKAKGELSASYDAVIDGGISSDGDVQVISSYLEAVFGSPSNAPPLLRGATVGAVMTAIASPEPYSYADQSVDARIGITCERFYRMLHAFRAVDPKIEEMAKRFFRTFVAISYVRAQAEYSEEKYEVLKKKQEVDESKP